MRVDGTVNGDIDATAGGALRVLVAGGTVNGNIEAGPGATVQIGSTVNGNIEVTGTPGSGSLIALIGGNFALATTVVNGDVIHNGTGVDRQSAGGSSNTGVFLGGFRGFGSRVDGNIQAENGAGVVNSSLLPASHTVTGNIKCNGVAGDDVLLMGNLENCG